MTPEPVHVASGRMAWVRHGLAATLHGVAVTVVTLSLAVAAVALFDDTRWVGAALSACWIIGIVVGLVAHRMRTPRWGAGRIAVHDDCLRVEIAGRGVSVPRGGLQVVRWSAAPAEGVWHLELRDHAGDTLRVQLRSREDGDALLRATALDAMGGTSMHRFQSVAHQVVVFVVYWPIVALVVTCLLGLLGQWVEGATGVSLPTDLVRGVWVLALLIASAFVVKGLRPVTVWVGADGITWDREFIPFARVNRVSVLGGALRVETVDGRDRRFSAAPPYEHAPTQTADAIEDRRRAWRPHAAPPCEPLARHGRSARSWRDDLTRHVRGDGVFRAAALDATALLEVVEAPGAPPSSRVGAALAVVGLDEERRARVRIAATACANAPLREALDAVVSDRLDDRHVARVERGEREREAQRHAPARAPRNRRE